MQDVIQPIDRELIKQELTDKYFLRPTNKANNLIYDITALTAPNTMREIGRVRELSYRAAGGGTGLDCDTDDMDYMQHPYHQLVVWDPENEQIVGGYRYICGRDMQFNEQGQPRIASSHLFYFTPYFIKDYLPYTIELGRAFVNLEYQKHEMGAKALYALDNNWDGLGAIFYRHPEIKYLIGKVTMYPNFDITSRDLIYAYLFRYHYDHKALIRAYHPLDLQPEAQELADELFIGDDPTVNFHILQRAVRARGHVIPPMFSAYLNLTQRMSTFGTSINHEFGQVLETGILVMVDNIYEDKRTRYIGIYVEYLRCLLREHRKQHRLAKAKEKQRKRTKKTISRITDSKSNM